MPTQNLLGYCTFSGSKYTSHKLKIVATYPMN
jgi:hypothetical protein